MSQAPQPIASPSVSSTPDGGDDPLAKLHRMSTTAGVAAQQYVAINGKAVVSLVLAAVSLWFGLMAASATLWLVLPLAGVICGIAAWRQIGNSNGTEKGKPFAAVGIVGCLVIGAIVIAGQLSTAAHAREDGRRMSAIVQTFTDRVKAGKLGEAYQLFSVPFRERVPEDLFTLRLTQIQDARAFGKLQSLVWNDVPPAYDSTEGGELTLGVISVISAFEHAQPHYTFVFRQVGNDWQLENIPEMFSAERKAPPTK